MNPDLRRVYVWCGPVFMVLLCVMMILSHLLPVPSPTVGAATLQHYYVSHATRIRVGLVIGTFGSSFLVPFVAALAGEVRRIHAGDSLAGDVQLMLGGLFSLIVFFDCMLFMTLAYRSDMAPGTFRALYDLAVIVLLTPISVLEQVLFGVTVLTDHGAAPRFPRWFGWYSLAGGVACLGGQFIGLVKSGPLAWNGLLAFYLPFAAIGPWILIAAYFMLRNVGADERAAG